MEDIQILDDTYFMKRALVEAEYALGEGEVPVGAIIVNNNKIIAKGYNLTQKLNDVTAHAEMQAITAAANYLGAKYLHKCTMYVTLEPCMMCAGALYWSQISKVVYGAEDNNRKLKELSLALHPKTELVKGILEKECKELLSVFFESKR